MRHLAALGGDHRQAAVGVAQHQHRVGLFLRQHRVDLQFLGDGVGDGLRGVVDRDGGILQRGPVERSSASIHCSSVKPFRPANSSSMSMFGIWIGLTLPQSAESHLPWPSMVMVSGLPLRVVCITILVEKALSPLKV